MVDPKTTSKQPTQGAPPSQIHVEKNKATSLLPWILLGLGILALLWFLFRPRHHEVVQTTTTTVAPADTVAAPVAPVAAPVVAATTGASVGELGQYLAGSDVAPRTFTFDNLHFDSAKSAIRAEDRATVDDVAGLLQKYPTTKVRIVGYADARGSEPANAKLGRDRAEAVKTALVAKSVAADRIETVSEGDTAPVASNDTSGGQAENRRTELVVVSR